MASLQLYQGLRRRAVAAGLDVIMIEHRGVGMSRRDDFGADLPPQALTLDQIVDDVAAVLDDVQVDSAVIYGTSYGTYIAAVRDAIRGRLLQGDKPETAALAPKVRQLVDAGLMTAATLLDRLLDLVLGGRIMLWQGLSRFVAMTNHTVPYRYEADLVNRIAFRELDYAAAAECGAVDAPDYGAQRAGLS
ncbi:hydrolase [Mycobacterium haemophilum DSM 44634]|nr:hypothetical protein B586_07970 [Mycobacterium haemophilum DSM 44634]